MLKLIYSLIAMQVLDGISTYLAITSGSAEELNPVGAWLFETLGLAPGLMTGKFVVITVLIGMAYSKPMSTAPRLVVLGLLNAFYAWVVISNFHLVSWHQLFL